MNDIVGSNLTPGYQYYKSIGSPKKIIAPMVDQSELSMINVAYGLTVYVTIVII